MPDLHTDMKMRIIAFVKILPRIANLRPGFFADENVMGWTSFTSSSTLSSRLGVVSTTTTSGPDASRTDEVAMLLETVDDPNGEDIRSFALYRVETR
jgi:hypothetical protein